MGANVSELNSGITGAEIAAAVNEANQFLHIKDPDMKH